MNVCLDEFLSKFVRFPFSAHPLISRDFLAFRHVRPERDLEPALLMHLQGVHRLPFPVHRVQRSTANGQPSTVDGARYTRVRGVHGDELSGVETCGSDETSSGTSELRRLSSLLEISQTLAAGTNQKSALHQVLGILDRHHSIIRSTVALLTPRRRHRGRRVRRAPGRKS